MKTALTAIALLAVLATSTTTVSANPYAGHRKDLQHFYTYFGAPCCVGITTPIMCRVAPPTCANPCSVSIPVHDNPCDKCATQYVPVQYG